MNRKQIDHRHPQLSWNKSDLEYFNRIRAIDILMRSTNCATTKLALMDELCKLLNERPL